MGARVLYFIVFRSPANFQFVGRGGSAASQTRMQVSSYKPLPTRCACYFIMVICASFYLDYRLSFHSPLTPFAWGRNSCVRFALFCIWGPHKFSIFGESGSSSRLMTQASFIATCLLNANRLPKPYCALRSQHLLLQMHSLSIIPAFHAGAFFQKKHLY